MHPLIRRAFSAYPSYDRLRYLQKIYGISRSNRDVFRQRLDRQREQEIRRYWRSYGRRINLIWHRAYNAVHPVEDVHRYIPEDVYYAYIEPTLNRWELAESYTDKNFYDRLFPDVATPEVLIRRINHRYYDFEYAPLEEAEAAEILGQAEGAMIIKPSIASGDGLNVRKLHAEQGRLWLGDRQTDLSQLTAMYGGDYVVQVAFQQHQAIAQFHPTSVNTTRLYTLRLGDQISVVAAVFRLGNQGRPVDNGGIPCGVGPDGRLNDQAVTKYFVKHDVHPLTKKPFKGFTIPGWSAACTLVQRLHRQLPYFDAVSWDIAIAPDTSPLLIEFNLCYQDINFLQVNNGPLYGEKTEAVLSRVFHRTASVPSPPQEDEESARPEAERIVEYHAV